jgi:hypothetical protein
VEGQIHIKDPAFRREKENPDKQIDFLRVFLGIIGVVRNNKRKKWQSKGAWKVASQWIFPSILLALFPSSSKSPFSIFFLSINESYLFYLFLFGHAYMCLLT